MGMMLRRHRLQELKEAEAKLDAAEALREAKAVEAAVAEAVKETAKKQPTKKEA